MYNIWHWFTTVCTRVKSAWSCTSTSTCLHDKFTFTIITVIIYEPCLFREFYSMLIVVGWLKLYLSCHKLVYLTLGWNSYYMVIFEQQQLLYIPRSSSAHSSRHVFDDVRAYDSLAAGGEGKLRKPWRQTDFICLNRETNFMKFTMY